MRQEVIKIRGARVHNLKNINVDIPRNRIVVFAGISGSGKSSLAFDTLYAEGQRRYVESLSAYARQFLGVMQKPDVDKIEGISPAIAIDQRRGAHNPRSTVGTITEIYDYIRLLFGRIGKPHCPKCKKPVSRQSVQQIVGQLQKLPFNSEIVILGPVVAGKKGEHRAVLEEIQRAGFVRVRVDGTVERVDDVLARELDRKKKHNIEVVVDRLIIEKGLDRPRLSDSVEQALKIGKGMVVVSQKAKNKNRKDKETLLSERFACEECGISMPEIEPRLFSFNNPYGACLGCTGLGKKLEVDPNLVTPNTNLSISEGAIQPWMRASHRVGRQGWYWQQLSELAEKYRFSLDDPVKDLSQKIINLVLYGDDSIEGVIPNLERRYRETDSDFTRQEIEQYMVERQCEQCRGKRLKPEALAVTVAGKNIDEIAGLSTAGAKEFFESLRAGTPLSGAAAKGEKMRLKADELKIADSISKEIIVRLQFLIDVGLEYLTLNRKAQTLAGGEEQRIRLATQIGSQLTGVLYILDEPSIGLHARDQNRLIETLKKLRDLGNTIVVVEHDPQTILAADWVIDVGPGAGKYGGKIVFEGTPKELLKSHDLTGEYLSGRKKVEVSKTIVAKGAVPVTLQGPRFLEIKGAKEHNLKNIDVKIPLGKFVCMTGVSGSGKSSLMNDILARALLKNFYHAKEEPGEHKEILGTEYLNKVVLVDQSPIGRTPRSNPATYTGTFSYIRDIFAKTREARVRGYDPGRFSFNVKGGRCEACEGQGLKKIEMYFLPDVYVECEACHGTRYNQDALEIEYKGKNIAQVLSMTVEEARQFFQNIPGLFQKLRVLDEVGLSYIQLGQPAPSLSGGEAQRIKLATELSRAATGKTLYILDEPTTGLHFDDVKKLLMVLRGLVDKGNTVLVIEHNLDLIKNADWIIDLGPEGGEGGGEIVAEGSPSEVAKNKKSYTGKYLRLALNGS
ncbi:MAG: excinuclease ABC subunit A [Candidatus Wildermuthbacteria bacterium RIFCSPHIGHO2_01_FULL_47_27]|nr:MAG: excinuclease ABC subunit A [Candidatus Wildermuthbacteria bacterium RIFCSPHIGHO2_01_FULL_47_27]